MTTDIRSRLIGKFQPENEADFEPVPLQLCDEVGHYLQKQVIVAFTELHAKAKENDIELSIISSTRNFDRQKRIWENKWNSDIYQFSEDGIRLSDKQKALNILKYSAMPGTSRHHWGTDFDLNSVDPSYFETDKGFKIYTFLKQNAGEFGFFQPYTPKSLQRPYGYEEEPWHWSYLPIAKGYLKLYSELIQSTDIQGFLGADYFNELSVKEKYVMGIEEKLIFGKS